jgi:hypothetical protein
MKANRFLLAASVALAMAFIFSCSSEDEGGGGDNNNQGGTTYSYCIYSDARICSSGTFTECQNGGILSNDCPFSGNQGNEIPSSSSAVVVVPPSSSSVAVVVPSSSSINAVPSSSSRVVQYCDYGPFTLQEDGELTGGCYPMGTSDDADNCALWGRVVASCPRLSKSSFTLSYAGSSYGDIDIGSTYTGATVQSVKENIDLVAYNDASNIIKNPCNVSTIGSDCGSPRLASIPAKYHAALRTATIASDVKQVLEAEDGAYNADEIPISSGVAFMVLSTDVKLYFVVITSVGTQSVTLEFYNPLL